MKNSIVLFVLLLCSEGWSQEILHIDTLRFAADSSYSRAILKQGNNIYFGTSKSGVVCYNETTKEVNTIIPPTSVGEFRDLAEHGDRSILAMVSGDHGLVFMHKDTTNVLVYNEPGVFLDDIDALFSTLYLVGDPVNGKFILKMVHLGGDFDVKTFDLTALENEACYAASGTTGNLGWCYSFVSGGGKVARYHKVHSNTIRSKELKHLQSGEGSGPFSLLDRGKRIIIVGGNYTQPTDTIGNCVYSNNRGKSFKKPKKTVGGYRSSVVGNDKIAFAGGTTGIDYTLDGGKTWTPFYTMNCCALLLHNNTLYATSNKGYCIRFEWKSLQ